MHEAVHACADWVHERVDPDLVVTHTKIITLGTGMWRFRLSTWGWDDENGNAPDNVSIRSDVSTPASVRSALIAMHELHESGGATGAAWPSRDTYGAAAQPSRHTYRCPDCGLEFEAWRLCRQHVREVGHANADNTKGLQQRCMKSSQEVPYPTSLAAHESVAPAELDCTTLPSVGPDQSGGNQSDAPQFDDDDRGEFGFSADDWHDLWTGGDEHDDVADV